MLCSTELPGRLAALLWGWLWPDLDAEGTGFRAEEDVRGVLGLRLAAGAAAISFVAFYLLFRAAGDTRPLRLDLMGTAICSGALALSFHPWGRRHARGIAVFIGWIIAALIIIDLAPPADSLRRRGADDHGAGPACP